MTKPKQPDHAIFVACQACENIRGGDVMTIFYHRTTDECAGLILRDGFRDGTGTYMTDQLHTGVWLSNVPLDGNEGASGDVLLQVELPSEEMVAEYEWIQDIGYREWLVPAALINEEGTRRVLERIVGGELDWTRIALTEAQVDQHDLRRLEIMKPDRRYRPVRYHPAIETEALQQQVIVQIVRDALDAELPEPLEDVLEREARQRGEIERLLKRRSER